MLPFIQIQMDNSSLRSAGASVALLITWSLLSVLSCPVNERVFNTGSTVTLLQFNAGSLPYTSNPVIYQVLDPRGTAQAQFVMLNGQITNAGVQTINLTFTGDTSSGSLNFRIDNVHPTDTGLYKIVKGSDNTIIFCNTVYITGSLSVPSLTSDNLTPSVGESVTLTCSSSSTTVPVGLPLIYTWLVDGATNPSYYTYSTSRDTLTISSVQKSDANMIFTCTGQEQGSQITSSTSNQLSIDVHYGPENVRLDPTQTRYTKTENVDTLASITCRADCNPTCTYTWTHLNSTWSNNVSILNLGQVSRTEAGVYRCTVTRSGANTGTVELVLVVQFPPSSVALCGNTSIFADGINKIQLKCTTATANPAATISWFKNGIPIDNTRTTSEIGGDYGGKLTSQILEVTPTRDNDGDIYRCTGSTTLNGKSPVSSQEKVLDDLKYPPIVNSITGPTTPVTEGKSTKNVFICNVSSSPEARVTWYHDNVQVHQSTSPDRDSTYSYTIPTINRTHTGVYKCVADNGIQQPSERTYKIIVLFAPLSVTLSGNTSIIANTINKVTLTCITAIANPAAYISWFKNGSPIDSTGHPNVTDGKYGGKITSQILELTPTRYDDGDTYKCTASNSVNVGSSVSSQQTLDLLYIPIVTVSMTPHDVTECTDELTLTCYVSSKPVSTIIWYKGQQQLPSTGTGNVNVYTTTDIDRKMTGQYRCVPNNGYGGNKLQTVDVAVKYQPDVSVTTTNVTTQASFVDIICNASGVPSVYTFSPWTHHWNINGPLLTHPGLSNDNVLKLTHLTYEYSGVYTCIVSNGIECSNNPDSGSGYVILLVKASPVVIDPTSNSNNERIRVASTLNSVAVFNFTFWSNAGHVEVKCYRTRDNMLLSTPALEITQTQTTVNLPVFTSSVSTKGTLASLSIQINVKEDFGAYDIVLTNTNPEKRRFAIIVESRGPPQAPFLEVVQVMSSSSVSVNWTRGFHGGLDQTIVIQISMDNINWQNKKSIPDGQNDSPVTITTTIEGLNPSTLFYMRMLAHNDEGRSNNVTEVLSFTMHAGEVPSTSSPVGAIVGGVGGVAAVIIIIAVVMFVLKQRNIIGGETPSDTELTQRANIYESANVADTSDHVYTHLQQPVSAKRDGGNIYEKHIAATEPEHIYTDLRRKERLSVACGITVLISNDAPLMGMVEGSTQEPCVVDQLTVSEMTEILLRMCMSTCKYPDSCNIHRTTKGDVTYLPFTTTLQHDVPIDVSTKFAYNQSHRALLHMFVKSSPSSK